MKIFHYLALVFLLINCIYAEKAELGAPSESPAPERPPISGYGPTTNTSNNNDVKAELQNLGSTINPMNKEIHANNETLRRISNQPSKEQPIEKLVLFMPSLLIVVFLFFIRRKILEEVGYCNQRVEHFGKLQKPSTDKPSSFDISPITEKLNEIRKTLTLQKEELSSLKNEVLQKNPQSGNPSISLQGIQDTVNRVFENQSGGIKNSLRDTEVKISKSCSSIQPTLERVSGMLTELKPLSVSIHVATTKIEQLLDVNYNSITEEYKQLVSEVRDQMLKVEPLLTVIANISKAEEEKKQLADELESKTQKIQSYESKLTAMQEQLQSAMSVVENDIPALESVKVQVEEDLVNARRQVDALDSQLKDANREIEECLKQIEQIASEKQRLNEAKNTALESVTNIEQTIIQKTLKINELQSLADTNHREKLAALTSLQLLESSIYPNLFQEGGSLASWKPLIEESTHEMNPEAKVLRGVLGAFSAMMETGKGEIQLSLLGEISRALTDWLYAQGKANQDVQKILKEWSTSFNSQYSGKFILRVPDLGDAVSLAWMTPTTGSLQVVSGVVTWMVRGPDNNKFSSAVVK